MKGPVVLGCVSVAILVTACSAPPSEATEASRTDREQVCTAATKPQIVAQMLAEPIKPPRYAAGLDLAGDATWSGLTKAAVDREYCAGIADGSDDALSYFIWGSDGNTYPVEAGFDADHKLGFVEITQPYAGGVDFASRPGSRFGDHTYTMHVGGTIDRDGAPLAIEWNDAAKRAETATELTDALVFTFAPELPTVQADCVTSQRCSIELSSETKKDDGGGLIAVRDLNFYVHVPAGAIEANPSSSSVDFFAMFPKPAHLSHAEPPAP